MRNLGRRPLTPLYRLIGVSAEEAPFSPADISGLTAWYDFSDLDTLYQDSGKTTPVTSDADPIGAAEDKSGNGYDVLQATSANKPTYKTGIQNGLAVARGDGGDNLASAAFTERSQPNTIFAVVINPTVGTEVFFDGISATKRSQVYHQTTVRWHAGTVRDTSDSAATVAVIYTAIFNGASSELYTDGVLTDAANVGSDGLTGVTLFSDYSGAGKLTGDLCEYLLYDSALSSGDIASVVAYLKTKWGIT